MTQLQPGTQQRTRERMEGYRQREREKIKKNKNVALVKLDYTHAVLHRWEKSVNQIPGLCSDQDLIVNTSYIAAQFLTWIKHNLENNMHLVFEGRKIKWNILLYNYFCCNGENTTLRTIHLFEHKWSFGFERNTDKMKCFAELLWSIFWVATVIWLYL